ncbi:MAG: hypothetical protein LBK64_07545, partial [Spirochaetaceae bacterium]|nr:hypothetical protein [Spirochaetaceae bacterium]
THDFRTTGTKTVTITAGGNPTPSASVTVTVKDFSLLGSLSISGKAVSDYNLYLTPAFSPTTTSYTLIQGSSHAMSNFTITINAAAAESGHAAVSGAGSNWNNGSGIRQITVTPDAGYGAARTYTINGL